MTPTVIHLGISGVEMGRGISKQQKRMLELLKERGETGLYGSNRYVWMSTREIVMNLHPEVEDYLAECRRYYRWIRRNMVSLPIKEIHNKYREHRERLKALPNYHTARTSVNRALRSLVRRGLVVRQPYWGMYSRQGVSAGWLLPEYVTDRLTADSEYLELLHMAYDLEEKEPTEGTHDVTRR